MRNRGLFCGLVIALLLLSAAGSVFAGSSKEQTGTQAPVEIGFGNLYALDEKGNPNFTEVMAKEWGAKNNIKINWMAFGTEYLTVTTKTWLASNTWPEGFVINTVDLATAARTGQLADITKELNADPVWKNSFLTGMLDSENLIDGKYYGVPIQFITNEVFYYNTDILAKAGYKEFPKTWSELLAYSEKVKGMGYLPIAMVDKVGWQAISHLVEPLCQYIMGPDWVRKIGAFTDQARYDDPRFVDVLKKLNELMVKGYLPKDTVSMEGGEDTGLYFTQKAAIYLSGSWVTGTLINTAPPEILAITKPAPLPRPENSDPTVKYGTFTGGSGWSHSGRADLSATKRPAVIALLKFLTSEDMITPTIQNFRIPPNKLPAGLDISTLPALQVEASRLFSAAPAVYPMNQEQNGAVMANTLYKTTQSMLVGAVTPEDAAKQIQEAYEKVVATGNK